MPVTRINLMGRLGVMACIFVCVFKKTKGCMPKRKQRTSHQWQVHGVWMHF